MDRRRFLSLSASGVLSGLYASSPGSSLASATAGDLEKIKTSAQIIIIGAGAAGTSLANRLTIRLDGARIKILDPSEHHLYQPGLSLVAAGLKPADYVVSRTEQWLPSGIELIRQAAMEIDPEAKTVTTADGQRLRYDFLIVAPGLVLDHDAIEGFELDRVGSEGIGSLYAGPDYAARTWQAASQFAQSGGVGLFTRPATEMKCAGAPLKHTFLIDDIARQNNARGNMQIIYANNSEALFGVPIVAEKVRMLFAERGIDSALSHVLKRIDIGRKIATFETPNGQTELGYDYIHVIPPQRAPDVVRQSGLSWQDKWADQGWVEVDSKTLRHLRYPDVFAVGDVAGVPKGKTAASVKWQVPVVEDHLVAQLAGKQGSATYNGYTSCPMITRVGRAMLIEFDYDNNLVPSFPGVIAPLEELWISWLMKELALKPTYLAMLRGKA